MSKLLHYKIIKRFYPFFILFFFVCGYSYSQNPTTTIKGIVLDSLTREPIPFATVQIDKTTNGVYTDDEGRFRMSTHRANPVFIISCVGYKSQKFQVSSGTTGEKKILLQSSDQMLNEIVIRPKKEKYSKKNNPAVDLIEMVISNKKKNNVKAQDYYQCKEYERTFLAINDFNPSLPQFKRYKFLTNYQDSSLIDNKPILPFSLRERVSDVYYRQEPKSDKRIVHAYNVSGIDQAVEAEGIDAVIEETFKDVSLFDNSITLLFHNFVSPLSEFQAVSFYKWYLTDTVKIDGEPYVSLTFAPFNSYDVGFTGSLFISIDGSYAVKKAILRTPRKMNMNFVDELVIHQEFKKTKEGVWIPDEFRMAIDLSLMNALKFYVDKTQTFEHFKFANPVDSVYSLPDPVTFDKGYLKRSRTYWTDNRPELHQKDYRVDSLVHDMKQVFLFKILIGAGKIISSGRFPINKDPEVNPLEIGTVPTFYSYNYTEGNRLRLTLNTTPNFHKNLFFYGYGAYGTKDNKFKYYTEFTWAFKERKKYKDEFPKNNLLLAFKYDANSLGQRFTQSERDNILMSLQVSKNQKITYSRQMQLMYERETHKGFTFRISAQTFDERPAGSLTFDKMDEYGTKYSVANLQTTQLITEIRYVPNEKFLQHGRKRYAIPSQRFEVRLANTKAFKNVLGGDYDFNKTEFNISREQWIAPYGKLTGSVKIEKIWGEISFPHLLSPSANNTFTIQKGNFFLIEPMEFVHDSQVSWEVYYHIGGWLFNRIPLIKRLKWREVVGFRGFYGELSARNNPNVNHDLLIFPQNTNTTSRNKPYMEYNVGVENIFKILRIDYVRRLNYLDHPNISKNGIRVSFNLTF